MVAVHEGELTRAIDAIESRFYLGGVAKRGIKLTVGNAECKFPMNKADAAAKLPGVFTAARQSAFGHGSETVLDPSVRVAKELTASEFQVNFDPQTEGILENIRLALVPEAGAVRAELYKLNIMTAGGFFKAHKDTPRGDAATCFGTLVVVLPVPFTGGQLTLAHGESKVSLDWGKSLQPPYYYGSYMFGGQQQSAQDRAQQWVPTNAGLQWAAFFGDVEHEVLAVTEGHRITLTYTLHRNTAPNPNADALLTRASGFHNQLKLAMADPEWMSEGGAIGFKCRHLYEESALAQAEAKLAAGGSAAYAAKLKLKNEDAVIAAVMASLGLGVQCVRLLQMEYLEDDYVLEKMPTKKDASSFGSRERIEHAFTAMGCDDDSIANFCAGTVADAVGEAVEWIGSHRAAKKEWVERYYSCTGYFGNEASTATFYTAAAFVAKIPPFDKRSNLIAAAQQTALTSEVVNPTAAAAAAATGGGAGASRRKSNGAPAARRTPAVAPPPPAAAAGVRTTARKRKSRELPADQVVLLSSDEEADQADQDQRDLDADYGQEDQQADQEPDHNDDDSDADYSTDQDSDDDSSSRKRQKKQSGRGTAPAAAAAHRSAAAPPNLFPAPHPSNMTAAQRKQAALARTRKIHITGGRGGKAGDGSCTIDLPPGAGVKELKQLLRRKFGKVSHSKMGSLMLCDAQGNPSSAAAKASDLVDGARVHCTYTYAQGNMANLTCGGFGGGFRRRGRGFGFGFWF